MQLLEELKKQNQSGAEVHLSDVSPVPSSLSICYAFIHGLYESKAINILCVLAASNCIVDSFS